MGSNGYQSVDLFGAYFFYQLTTYCCTIISGIELVAVELTSYTMPKNLPTSKCEIEETTEPNATEVA